MPVDSLKKFSVAILAGGQSRRMGCNKALIKLGNKPVIAHVIDALKPLSDDLFIAGGRAAAYREFAVPHVADQYHVRASITGLYSALAAARHEHCLVAPCDMPFAPAAIVPCMFQKSAGFDAVIPAGEAGLQPLFGLYFRGCLEVLRKQIECGELAISGALARLKVREINIRENFNLDPELVFMNLNTRKELSRAERMLPFTGFVSRKAALDGLTPEMRPRFSQPPLICFVGKKNSGKTTFLEQLVKVLTQKGLNVAFIKHDVHGFVMDYEGTDTWRLFRAGAREVAISSPHATAAIRRVRQEAILEDLYRQVDDQTDIVLAEGFKSSSARKIEVSRTALSKELVCRESELEAVISDRPDAATTIPVFGFDDAQTVAELLMTGMFVGNNRSDRPANGKDRVREQRGLASKNSRGRVIN